MLNIPLLGSESSLGELNLRVSGAALNRDGVQDNDFKAPGVPDELGTVDRNVGLLHLHWQPMESLSVLYTYDVTRVDELPIVPWTTITNNAVAGPLLAPFVEADESDYPASGLWDETQNETKTDVDGYALNISWDLSENMSLHSISGYREMENSGAAGADGSPLPVLSTFDVQEFESFSQEFRLLGSALDSRLEYTAGLFYWDEEGDVYNTIRVFGGPGPANAVAKYTNESWASYAQVTYNISDRLNVTGGARYTEEERSMNKAVWPAIIL